LGVTESLFFKNFDLLPVRLPRRSRSVLPEVERAPSAPMPRSIEVGVEAEPFNNWTVDVKLVTDDPFLVRSNLAETDVSIDLRVSGKLEKPVPDGRVWLEEGEVKLPFSAILVQEGEVVFNEETGFNPALEFRVTAEASEYKITGYIYNRALDPKWVLTSNPPLPQEDILTLVGTGSTRDGLAGSGQGDLAKMAGKYALSAFRKEKAVESREPTFFDEISDRSKVEIEGIDMKTGEVTMGGQIRLWEELYLNGKFGQEGSYRAMLKYLFKFK
ncbi:MAG: translocation/assembly module TamB domain-containing protein, partial [Verrucomicrobiales bacterium]|nr:translocation/assembly module TamB domain-containing protein [Verrucomicrobiales bacterium]